MATVNSEYYVGVLAKLKEAIKQKRRGKWTRHVLLQHDNAAPHTSQRTQTALADVGFEVIPHPAYSPDLAPSDFWLFDSMKKPLRGKHYSGLPALATAISQWEKSVPKEWYRQGLEKLPVRWRKCIQVKGDYVEKTVNE